MWQGKESMVLNLWAFGNIEFYQKQYIQNNKTGRPRNGLGGVRGLGEAVGVGEPQSGEPGVVEGRGRDLSCRTLRQPPLPSLGR